MLNIIMKKNFKKIYDAVKSTVDVIEENIGRGA